MAKRTVKPKQVLVWKKYPNGEKRAVYKLGIIRHSKSKYSVILTYKRIEIYVHSLKQAKEIIDGYTEKRRIELK